MTITHDTMTVETVLQAVRQLAPTIFDRAGEIEAGRRVPVDLLDSLRAAGCFRLIRPATHGGLEASVADAMRTLESLARADASVAWTVMIGAGSWIDLAHLPRQTFDALYATNPDAITAGVFNPTGSIAPVDGGYRSPVAGASPAGVNTLTCSSETASKALSTEYRRFVERSSPPVDVAIEDTWSVSGLCGTGSHHFRVDHAVVPAERTYTPMNGEPCVDALIVHLPPPAVFSLVMASVALGIAQGALDDITVLASDKVPLLSPVALGGNPLFQFELATADTDVRAARSLLYEEADTAVGGRGLWRSADHGASSAGPGVRGVDGRAGDFGRHRRLPRWWRNVAVLRLPPPASASRHPRPRAALHRPPRHTRHGRRDSRRAGRPTHGVLRSEHEAHV